MSRHQPTHSGLELVTEVADLLVGVGILFFTLAPLALPALALAAVAVVALLIPPLVGAVVAAPILVLWRVWRSRHRTPVAARPAGGGEAAAPRSARRGRAQASWLGRTHSTSIT
jgi:hypothetical protein